jgi:molecular chaperone GrpE (heat shock protein)
MDENTNQDQILNALRHEVQHLQIQVKMLQQSIDGLKNRNTNDAQSAKNYMGAPTIGKIIGKD